MEQSSNSIAERTGFDKQRVMQALTKIRLVMIKDVPDIFSGTVEVDETYLGGQWKNKRKSAERERLMESFRISPAVSSFQVSSSAAISPQKR
jgi:hypothetical protein